MAVTAVTKFKIINTFFEILKMFFFGRLIKVQEDIIFCPLVCFRSLLN